MSQAAAIPATFCVICDAQEGDCDHNAWRYTTLGFNTDPEWDRANTARIEAKYSGKGKKTKVDELARDVEDVIRDISDIVYLDPPLEANLRTTHGLDPLGVSRLAAATVQGAVSGKLTSPGGFLAKRLGEIRRTKTKAT